MSAGKELPLDNLDEIILKDIELVHLEMMDQRTLWGAFYRDDVRIVIWVHASKGRLTYSAEADDGPWEFHEGERVTQ